MQPKVKGGDDEPDWQNVSHLNAFGRVQAVDRFGWIKVGRKRYILSLFEILVIFKFACNRNYFLIFRNLLFLDIVHM